MNNPGALEDMEGIEIVEDADTVEADQAKGETTPESHRSATL